MNEKKIEHVNIELIELSKIKFDKTNPNKMTDAQFEALKKNLTNPKVGNIRPVILNKDMKIIDGEHRVRAYIDLEAESIPCVVLDLTKTEVKMQRQIQNKLHGEHDLELDLKDLIIIENEGLLKEFAESLGKPEDDFIKMLSNENRSETEEVSFQTTKHKCPKCGAKF